MEPFKKGDLVKTIKGAKFEGVVVSCYRIDKVLVFIGMRQRDMELPPEWRVDVMAVHPKFAGTIHVYPAVQLAKVSDGYLGEDFSHEEPTNEP